MKILLTGGAGFIGRHLVARLARNSSHSITVIDNFYRGSRRAPERTQCDVGWIEGDIRDRDLLSSVMPGTDVVLHLAAQSNVVGAAHDLDYSFSTNVAGTFNILDAALRARVKKVMFASSREVYGEQDHLPVSEHAPLNPKNAYGVSKLAGEAYCGVYRSAGLPVTILRLANVYGPGDRGRVIPIFAENALCGKPLTLYGGDQVLDFIWIGAVIEAFERAMEMRSFEEPVNIGSGRGVTVRELAQIVIDKAQSQSNLVNAPSRSFETRGYIADIQKAREVGLLRQVEGPLAHLDSVLRDVRSELSLDGTLAASV